MVLRPRPSPAAPASKASTSTLSIGQRNADFTREWLDREGIPLLASDFLGPGCAKFFSIHKMAMYSASA
ncbi:MAG: hypothetical protein ACM3SV_12060 [Betaproteobacteria bacterium]